jgi:hypothetical protein
MLAVAEYSYNNSKHSTTNISPFYVNYGFEQRSNWATEIQFRKPVLELYDYDMSAVDSKISKQL